MNMGTLFVIDACSLINLLRIDDDEDFLYKQLKSLPVHMAEKVYDEIKTNIFKNSLDSSDKKRISVVLSMLPSDFVLHSDIDIVNYIGRDWYDKILIFTKHGKKSNGELLSSILSLILSREEESKVYFFTDDFPAKKQFDGFFRFQQIGIIEDSVDLLISLHLSVPKEKFPLATLRNKLIDLKAEYMKNINSYIEIASAEKTKYRRNEKEWKLLDNVENAYRKGNKTELAGAIDAIYKSNNSLKNKMPISSSNPEIVNKVNGVLGLLDKYELFRIA